MRGGECVKVGRKNMYNQDYEEARELREGEGREMETMKKKSGSCGRHCDNGISMNGKRK